MTHLYEKYRTYPHPLDALSRSTIESDLTVVDMTLPPLPKASAGKPLGQRLRVAHMPTAAATATAGTSSLTILGKRSGQIPKQRNRSH